MVTLSPLATMISTVHLKFSPNVFPNVFRRHKISPVLLSSLMLCIIIIISLLCLERMNFHPIIHERKVPFSNPTLFVLPHRISGMSVSLIPLGNHWERKGCLVSMASLLSLRTTCLMSSPLELEAPREGWVDLIVWMDEVGQREVHVGVGHGNKKHILVSVSSWLHYSFTRPFPPFSREKHILYRTWRLQA